MTVLVIILFLAASISGGIASSCLIDYLVKKDKKNNP